MTFAWSKITKPRPALKECDNPVVTSLTYHCVGVMQNFIQRIVLVLALQIFLSFILKKKKFWLNQLLSVLQIILIERFSQMLLQMLMQWIKTFYLCTKKNI